MPQQFSSSNISAQKRKQQSRPGGARDSSLSVAVVFGRLSATIKGAGPFVIAALAILLLGLVALKLADQHGEDAGGRDHGPTTKAVGPVVADFDWRHLRE